MPKEFPERSMAPDGGALAARDTASVVRVLHPGATIDALPARKISAGDWRLCSRSPVSLVSRATMASATARDELTLSDSTPHKSIVGEGATSPSTPPAHDAHTTSERLSTTETPGRDASSFPIPANEPERLAALRALDIVDSPSETA